MFMFKASAYLVELKKLKPEILRHCQDAAHDMLVDFGFKRLNADAFSQCESESIDYAVMEKTDQAVVVPMDAGWSDIGSWNALYEESKKDENGNAIKGDVMVNNTSGAYIHAESRLVAAIGMKVTKLSLQKHQHRAEHWVVVSGTARVYRNDEEFMLGKNESIFIPLGHTHPLENPGDTPLEIIEVQSGSYLGEDDIIRFEDKYGRQESKKTRQA